VKRSGTERFLDADSYVAYLKTIRGRLRTDVGWINLRSFLPAPAAGLRALDVGGGTGSLALRLAETGFEVVLLDSSARMLEVARREADAARMKGSILFRLGDATHVSDFFDPSSFHVIVCHNLLEFMENPRAALRALAGLLEKDRGSVVSLLVRNRWGEVIRAAVKEQDTRQAKAILAAETVLDSLYGEPVRVFDPNVARSMVEQAGLEPLTVRGVRVASDYRECSVATDEVYSQLLELELLLGAQPQFAAVARYSQIIARPRFV
jgi:S-adenosylmethionine-dependent methyltransferase